MFKKYIYIVLGICTTFSGVFASTRELPSSEGATAIKNGIIPGGSKVESIITVSENQDGFSILNTVINFIKGSIFDLLMLISLAVFLYIGAKLVIARGDPEQFKKAMLSFVYAGVGLFIVAASWAAVTLIAGLNF